MANRQIRLGFMPLLDAAIPIVAARCGFAEKHGLTLDLVRETSWANVRDRLAIGHFDAAHLLAPLPIAAAIGLNPLGVPLLAPMSLGTGGNAITVSRSLLEAMLQLDPAFAQARAPRAGAALARLVARRQGAAKPVFAVVHAFSTHNYQLRHWLSEAGLDPRHDIDIVIVPPTLMPDALAAGRIDGFCVGEPWSSLAVQRGEGEILITGDAIWPISPEKVLAFTRDRAERRPEILEDLLLAMQDAAEWCSAPENGADLAAVLSTPDILDLPVSVLDYAMARIADPEDAFLRFSGEGVNLPKQSDAAWLMAQMLRWGQAQPAPDLQARAMATFRGDLYAAMMLRRGTPLPQSLAKEAAPSFLALP